MMGKSRKYELVNKNKSPEVTGSPLHEVDLESPEVREPKEQPSPWWRVAALIIPPNWWGRLRFVVCIFFLLASRIATLSSPMALSVAIDSMEHNAGKAVIAIIIYGIMRFSTDLFSNLQSQCWSSVSTDITKVVACLLFEHLHALSLRWHLKRKTGATLSQMERGVAGVSNLIQYSLFTLAPTLLQLILVSFIFWQLNVPAVVVCLVIASGSYVALTVILTKWRIPQRKARNAAANDVTNRAVDSLINFETVKYFAAEHVEAKRYADLRDIQKGHDIEVATSLAILNVAQSFVIQVGLVSSLLFAAHAVSKGHMSTGDFVACQLYVLELFRPLTMLGTVWSILVNAATDCVEIDALLRVTPEVVDDPDNLGLITLPPTSTTQKGYGGLSVSFQKVNFSYGEGLPGIKDLTFSVKAGGSVALVGPSGSGKSTSGRLLCRLYEADEGDVFVGGVDVKRIEQKELRSVISVVAQETVLFNETIMFNVAYGLPGATRDQVENACRKAQLHDKILSWPEGYETNVGERGLRLSGGEKQRLGIARALVRDPAILLLDEATSALDTTTERQIQGAFEAASKGRTTLTIAHRLSTIIDCDEILVLREGSVIERGSHMKLLGMADGVYKEMWEAQQQQQEKEEKQEEFKCWGFKQKNQESPGGGCCPIEQSPNQSTQQPEQNPSQENGDKQQFDCWGVNQNEQDSSGGCCPVEPPPPPSSSSPATSPFSMSSPVPSPLNSPTSSPFTSPVPTVTSPSPSTSLSSPKQNHDRVEFI